MNSKHKKLNKLVSLRDSWEILHYDYLNQANLLNEHFSYVLRRISILVFFQEDYIFKNQQTTAQDSRNKDKGKCSESMIEEKTRYNNNNNNNIYLKSNIQCI